MRREQVVPRTPEEVWSVVSDPDKLPTWWPSVSRVEDASPQAWTMVLTSPKGKSVRMDFTLVSAEAPRKLVWRQELAESPFERILSEAVTSVILEPEGEGTRVAIALAQKPRGWARFAPLQFRAAGTRQVQGALEGLGRLLS